MSILLKLTVGITLFLFLYFLFLFYPIYRAVKISDGMIANTQPYEQHPSNPNMYVLVAGDSTAVGVGSTNPNETIAGRIGQQFPMADITNMGVSGAKLKDLLVKLQETKRNHYDLIILQIGANDIAHFTPYNNVKSQISSIVSLSNTLGSKTVIFTSGNVGGAPVFRWPLSTLLTTRTINVRKIFIDEISQYNKVVYIDLFNDLKDDPLGKNIKKYYAPDLFHLTGDGYGIWYMYVQNQL